MVSFISQAWNRLRGKPRDADHAPSKGPTAQALVADTAVTPAAQRHAVSPAGLGARRPVISASGGVVGFEFRIHQDLFERLTRAPNPGAQIAYATAVLASARLTAVDKRISLARLPANWLQAKMAAQVGPGVMVALESPPQTTADSSAWLPAILALRQAGARVGWSADLNLALPRDFVLLRQGDSAMHRVLASVAEWPGELTHLPKVITDVGHLEDLELALASSIEHVCGALVQRGSAAPSEVLPLPPQSRRIGSLLQMIINGAPTQTLVEHIKGDVGLSFRLLKRLKAAELAHLQDCESVEQAVQLLGHNELYRWLSILLLSSPCKRPTSLALQEVALWRARLLELLAIQRQQPAPGQLFALGLASMLGPLLGISRQDVVDTLNLSSQGREALLDNTGPWAPYLQVVQSLESHAAEPSGPFAQPADGQPDLNETSEQAWQWATANMEQAQQH